jgi:(p)ppGpp synthase/HD superfamily hydrolase
VLKVKELDVLLAWYQAPKVSGAKQADKLVQWQNIVASKKAPPLIACWMNDDEERMNGLTMESISTADTHYGRHAALMERELEAAVDSMSRDKRNELLRKMDECEMEDEATDLGGEQAQGTVSADRETGAV